MYSFLKIGHIVSLAIFIFVGFVLVRASIVSGSRVPVRFKKRLYYGIMAGTIAFITLLAYSQGQKPLGFHSRLSEVAAQYDSRMWLKERSIRKGTIFDRTGDPGRALAVSVRNDAHEMIRSYPFGRYSGHIVGYSDRERGRTGIEAAFHATLLGMQFGYLENTKRFVADRIATDVTRGSDVYLTIDSKLQAAAYESLENRRGAVVVLDPRSGEIFVLVSSPGFSPNDVRSGERWRVLIDQEDDAPLFNRALNGLYPPGSVMKIVVAVAALESGIDPVPAVSGRKMGRRPFMSMNTAIM